MSALEDILEIEASLGVEKPFLAAFKGEPSQQLVEAFVRHIVTPEADAHPTFESKDTTHLIHLGLSAFNAFLQTNVTGPVLEHAETSNAAFAQAYTKATSSDEPRARGLPPSLISLCLRWLDTDGVSVYTHIPHIELFCLARFIFVSGAVLPIAVTESDRHLAPSLAWCRFRIHLWHYRLLTQPSLGAGSLFTKAGNWTDVPSLQTLIERSLQETEVAVSNADPKIRIQFLLEKANCHILLGNDGPAREALDAATKASGLQYALSGALGKRTKFQENSISQMVVLAKSREETGDGAASGTAPEALSLNDDTLLENLKFDDKQNDDETPASTVLPQELQDIKPDDQPKLKPEDEIILLTEATVKDTFSPPDALTAEEVLPYATRVIKANATNWQIYTQALLVRSRIELSRSRTLERAVLQMQAVVDQVVVDTQETARQPEESKDESTNVPQIQVTSGDEAATLDPNKPTSFLPAAKPTESASPQERLKYVHTLASPPRWHLESELAFAWTSVGSLVSALEIFKRLRLWPEVALCLATNAAADDPDGRGSGGDDKARAIVRWRLFHRTGETPETASDDHLEDATFDISTLRAADFMGPERYPPPPNAPRLFCILGDAEQNPQHYIRAWEVSGKRFARAQRSLAEYYLQQKDWTSAREAYSQAVRVNRFSPEMWSRLGDIELRLANFPDAAEAFQRAIATANPTSGGDDARTWSNLGTSLLSWYRQVVQETQLLQQRQKNDEPENLEEMTATKQAAELNRPARKLLLDALSAFKRGATIANSNWKIWDNVVTLAASMRPEPAYDDMILAVRNVLQIRKSEEAIDVSVLSTLVQDLRMKNPNPNRSAGGEDNDDSSAAAAAIYIPGRGTTESKLITLFEEDVVPLITTRSEPWSLVSILRAWRRDYVGAVEAAEKGWRTAMSPNPNPNPSLLSSSSASSTHDGNWQTGQDGRAWEAVTQRTAELVAAYENWGPMVPAIGEAKWKGKARMAVRSVMGKGKESWEGRGDEGWGVLEGLMEGLRA